jgi:4-hydroxyproline epimerase
MIPERLDDLMAFTLAARKAKGMWIEDGVLVDHIELFAHQPGGAVNFVLCPGQAYDRSPCGTGTSAKVACLVEDGHLAEGEIWRQTSVTGGEFLATYRRVNGEIRPEVSGRAFVTAEMSPIFDPEDPFRYGL